MATTYTRGFSARGAGRSLSTPRAEPPSAELELCSLGPRAEAALRQERLVPFLPLAGSESAPHRLHLERSGAGERQRFVVQGLPRGVRPPGRLLLCRYRPGSRRIATRCELVPSDVSGQEGRWVLELPAVSPARRAYRRLLAAEGPVFLLLEAPGTLFETDRLRAYRFELQRSEADLFPGRWTWVHFAYDSARALDDVAPAPPPRPSPVEPDEGDTDALAAIVFSGWVDQLLALLLPGRERLARGSPVERAALARLAYEEARRLVRGGAGRRAS